MSEDYTINPAELKKYYDGVSAIRDKMLADRPTLRAYLRRCCESSARSHADWKDAGNLDQASYRNGMWYAYRDIERMLEQDKFKEEKKV